MRQRLVTSALLALSCAGPALAHDFWIEPSSFRPAAGAPVSAALRVGVGFEGEVVPRQEARIVRFALVGPSAERRLVGREGADPAGYARVVEPGTHVIGYQSDAAVVDLDAAKVAVYVREEGLEPFLKATAPIRDRYARCAKALLQVGREDAGFDRRLGLPLELIPRALPRRGRVPFQLLRDGEPVKDVLVTAVPRSAPARKVSARTDPRGTVVLPLDAEGPWLVKAVHVVPGEAPREWNSLWASLTFEVP